MSVLCCCTASLKAAELKYLRLAAAAGIVRLLRDLDRQARKAGGAVYMLNGNHESLNVCGDFRYAAAGEHQSSSVPVRPHAASL